MIKVLTDLNETPPSAWPRLLAAQHAVEELGVQLVEDHVSAAFDALRDLVWADRASMAVVVRVSSDQRDALAGWRLAWLHSPSAPKFSRLIRPVARFLKWNDEHRAGFSAGTARASAVHCVGPDAPPSHRRFNSFIGVAHRLGAVMPISENIETYMMFNRKKEAFSDEEVATSLAAAHVFRRLMRRWCAQLGILDDCVLSSRERDVLVCLLRGLSEKAGADELGVKPSYFHQVVVRVYGKLRVDSRAALLTKCLERPAVSDEFWSGKPLMFIGDKA